MCSVRGPLNALQIHILSSDKLKSSFNKYLETETSPDTRELIDKDRFSATAGINRGDLVNCVGL